MLYYVKERCLLLQVAGYPTNISQLQKPKHQSDCIQNLSEVFQSFAKSKWLFMIHAHVTPKSIKIICECSKISGVYIHKNGLVYNIQNIKTCKYIICYSSSTQKTNHLKLITVSITFNLIDLFFKTRHVFKTKSIIFDEGSLNTGITKYFLI